MNKEKQTKDHFLLTLPKNLFLFTVVVALLTPFVARLPQVPLRGWEWVTAYFPGIGGILFLSVLNLIPSIAWYLIGKKSRKAPLVFWFSVASGVAFLLWAHGSLNLSSSSTAAIAFIFIPAYAVGAIIIGAIAGLIFNASVNDVSKHVTLALGICVIVVISSVLIPLNETRSTVKREARFPYTALSNIPLQKSQVYGSNFYGRVDVLAYGNFDNDPGNEIAVLGKSAIATLIPGSYEVKSKQEFCSKCTFMYQYLVPDGKGSIFVSASNGVFDINGDMLWEWKADGFTRVVPIQLSGTQPTFFAYQSSDYVVLHNADGQVLWKKNIRVNDVGKYTADDGKQLPFASTIYKDSNELTIFNLEGKIHKKLKLPSWGRNIEGIAWPTRGHLLVGSGSWFGVMDLSGNQILKHVVKDTSFRPYHGPFGVAVKLNPFEGPYLAVLINGSSGYARSVLLVFNPEGKLVWKEELKRLSTLVAIPDKDGTREVLLVGGIDGIFEYKLLTQKEAVKSAETTR